MGCTDAFSSITIKSEAPDCRGPELTAALHPLIKNLDALNRNGVGLTHTEDILALSALPTLHRDPFDRLIIAQANRRGFHLVTHDPELARYPVAVLW